MASRKIAAMGPSSIARGRKAATVAAPMDPNPSSMKFGHRASAPGAQVPVRSFSLRKSFLCLRFRHFQGPLAIPGWPAAWAGVTNDRLATFRISRCRYSGVTLLVAAFRPKGRACRSELPAEPDSDVRRVPGSRETARFSPMAWVPRAPFSVPKRRPRADSILRDGQGARLVMCPAADSAWRPESWNRSCPR